MPTRAGWGVAAISILLGASSRVFGIFELVVLAVAGLATVVVAVAFVHFRTVRLDVRRTIDPSRLHAGTPCAVDLHVTTTARRSPVMSLRDGVSGTRGAEMRVGPLRRGEVAAARYRLPTQRRGVVDVGPLEVEITDPFGLVRRRFRALGTTSITVYPAVRRVNAPPRALGADPMAGVDVPTGLTHGGDEFHALRPYIVGDELKRVHWPSTARHDELMVRQDEMPWQSRTTIVLDDRASAFRLAGLDMGTDITASLLRAAEGGGELVRLMTFSGLDSGYGSGHGHLCALYEELAVLPPSESSSAEVATARLIASRVQGVVVVVSAPLSASEARRIAEVRSTHTSLWRIEIDPSAWQQDATPVPRAPFGRVVLLDAAHGFVETWNTATRRATEATLR